MKHGIIVACSIGLILAASALAAPGSTNAPPMNHRPTRLMMGNLLPPRILNELALTGDQQTKYDSLNASFKSDLAQWEANNGQSGGTTTNAAPSGDRQTPGALRRSYMEKLRGFLTADQNAKLTQANENGPGRGRRGVSQTTGTNSPPPPPLSEGK